MFLLSGALRVFVLFYFTIFDDLNYIQNET